MSYARNGSGAEIIEENNFYPFGLKHEGYNALIGNPSYNYQYNGKEYQKETGWSDYGARMYMADIGRWGVIDPLAETSRRFTPYNYALNNPVMFIDPDGRKAYSPEPVEMVQSLAGAWGYFATGGSATWGSFAEFLGQDNLFYQSASGGGGMTFTDPTMIAFIQRGVLQPGFINGLFSLAEQLEKAGFKDPASTKASYKDLGKLLIGVPSLTELYQITGTEFIQDDKGKHPAETVDKYVYLTMSKIKNILFFAYTFGHEMNHVFDNRFFKDKFIEITKFGGKESIPFRTTFGLYKESNGLGWEIQMGNSNLLKSSGFEAATFYYGPKGWGLYNQNTVDKLSPYINELNRARSIIYNAIKNNLK